MAVIAMTAIRGDVDRIGLLIVGYLGMTGSAVAAGLELFRQGILEEGYGVTSTPAFQRLPFPAAQQVLVGGWDLQKGHLWESAARHSDTNSEYCHESLRALPAPMTGVYGELDFPLRNSNIAIRCETLEEGASKISSDIQAFRARHDCDMIVVVYLGSPARRSPVPLVDRPIAYRDVAPAAMIYAVGACEAGAHFIDFTPSEVLESRALHRLAERSSVQLAGRDGSTGQTFLKLALAEALTRRGLNIDAWYSTNLIGNHDGYVLSHDAYAESKIQDKLSGLSAFDPGAHRVSIEFIEHWGDKKEAWDAVELRGWLDSAASMRINWRGVDSFLAAPLVLDLVRLLAYGAGRGRSGVQSDLGYFFKHPIGCLGETQSQLWRRLEHFCE